MTQSELIAQWQRQNFEAPRVSKEYVAHLLSKFDDADKRVRLQIIAVRLIAVSVLAVLLFKQRYWVAASFVVAGIYIRIMAMRAKRIYKTPEPSPNVDALTYYRQRLEFVLFTRKRFWRRVPYFLPVLGLLMAGLAIESPHAFPTMLLVQVSVLTILIILLGIENRYYTKRVLREIEAVWSLRA
jgi:hypothetical protein